MYKKLYEFRKLKGYSINDMAKIIFKTPATYYKKEIGKVAITVKEAILISKKLNSSVEILFMEE